MPLISLCENETKTSFGLRPDQQLTNKWIRAQGGDPEARDEWMVDQGGKWNWHNDGISIKSTGSEWSSFIWQKCNSVVLKDLKNFIIDMDVSGKAEAAGLSFGHYKDFMAPMDSSISRRHLQLEVDIDSGCWAFRIDGQLQGRLWWNSAVRSVEDIINGILTLKAKKVEQALFCDLRIYKFQSSCQLSVIITCNRFLQRLRVSLRNWCHQNLPSGSYEVLVVNPASPDGTHDYLASVANSYSHVRVREFAVDPDLSKNKGAMINSAVRASRGEWIMLTDADCLFSPDTASMILGKIKGNNKKLFYGERRHLSSSQTDALLTGCIDGLRDFEGLSDLKASKTPETVPWGYTQIVHRSVLERIPYREGFNHFAHSDNIFIEDCKRNHVMPERINGLFCLHMDHPFTWYGTDLFL